MAEETFAVGESAILAFSNWPDWKGQIVEVIEGLALRTGLEYDGSISTLGEAVYGRPAWLVLLPFTFAVLNFIIALNRWEFTGNEPYRPWADD